jgi:hypothetical protein
MKSKGKRQKAKGKNEQFPFVPPHAHRQLRTAG